jgi:hypothetical protein
VPILGDAKDSNRLKAAVRVCYAWGSEQLKTDLLGGLMKTITSLVRKHHQINAEELARDVVFRRSYSSSEGRSTMPWGLASQDGEFADRKLAIYEQLDLGHISETDSIEALTALMEEYYGCKYPLP